MVVVLGVIAAVVIVRPVGFVPGPPAPPIAFQTPGISGNATAGWTYRLAVLAIAAWEEPRPIVWGDLNVQLALSQNTSWLFPYPAPAGSALWVESATGAILARGNLTLGGLWQDGYFVLVQTSQVLVLHTRIPPGSTYIGGAGVGTYVGPVLVVQYENAGNSITFNLQL